MYNILLNKIFFGKTGNQEKIVEQSIDLNERDIIVLPEELLDNLKKMVNYTARVYTIHKDDTNIDFFVSTKHMGKKVNVTHILNVNSDKNTETIVYDSEKIYKVTAYIKKIIRTINNLI